MTPNQETLDLLSAATKAIFEAEQAIRREEGVNFKANKPMYHMRIQLAEITDRYMANLPVCDWVPPIRLTCAIETWRSRRNELQDD
ncbi:hypothetical protein LCGC14_1306850 [marine sediment metagenome]|uniref:Uncharacterized protein n=1 Tax=marine sediment metagenome TaxID=412755 RepID=A0A0F9KNY6_9ZZZZ